MCVCLSVCLWQHVSKSNDGVAMNLTTKPQRELNPIDFDQALLSYSNPRETTGQMGGLREKLEEVNWTVGAVNHTFSSDISVHHLKIQDLQVRNQSQTT